MTTALWVALCLTTLAIRAMEGTWSSPATFFAGLWVLLSIVPIAVGPLNVAPAGMAFVVAASIALAGGAAVRRRRLQGAFAMEPAAKVQLPLFEWLVIACVIAGLATVETDLASRHYGPQVFLSPTALVKAAHDFSVARYSSSWQEPAAAHLLVSFIYLGALLGGVGLAVGRTKVGRWIGIASFVPAGLLAALLTTKATLIVPAILFGSSFLAARLSYGQVAPRPKLKHVIFAIASIALGVVFLGLVQMGRYGYTSPDKAMSVFSRLSVDVLGYFGVFSSWLQRGGWRFFPPTGGFYTFAGVFDFLRIHPRPEGLYADSVMLQGEPFNIYTAFRGLIQDFTLPGALVFLFVIGFLAQYAFERVRAGNFPFVAGLAAFYAFAMWTPVVDIFIYNTILLSYGLLAAYLLWTRSARLPTVFQLRGDP